MRRYFCAASVLLIVGASHIGMLYQAYFYAHFGRDYEFFVTPEMFFGSIGALIVLMGSARIVYKSFAADNTFWILMAFSIFSIFSELIKADVRFGGITTFIAIIIYYFSGFSLGFFAGGRGLRLPFANSLLIIYLIWYSGLCAFYFSGLLGMFSDLEGAWNASRLTFIDGYTPTEIVIWTGLHLPVIIHACYYRDNSLRLTVPIILLACSLILLALTASAAAIAATLGVLLIFAISNGNKLSYVKIFLGILLALLVLILIIAFSDSLMESIESKIIRYLTGEGSRMLAYLDLIESIKNYPLGIGKGRYVESNSLRYDGEGMYPHNNILGIGAELGWIPMLLYISFILLFFFKNISLLKLYNGRSNKRLRLLMAISLGVLFYQQFRGIFHDTWTIKEMYMWVGLASGAVAYINSVKAVKSTNAM